MDAFGINEFGVMYTFGWRNYSNVGDKNFLKRIVCSFSVPFSSHIHTDSMPGHHQIDFGIELTMSKEQKMEKRDSVSQNFSGTNFTKSHELFVSNKHIKHGKLM